MWIFHSVDQTLRQIRLFINTPPNYWVFGFFFLADQHKIAVRSHLVCAEKGEGRVGRETRSWGNREQRRKWNTQEISRITKTKANSECPYRVLWKQHAIPPGKFEVFSVQSRHSEISQGGHRSRQVWRIPTFCTSLSTIFFFFFLTNNKNKNKKTTKN